ncbi:MAG: response regulator transcription factor [Elusimicrobia bacterium]|nr:response regulator transcription factor [Elusimicrobiota bacterium]
METILIADDNELIREGIKDYIEQVSPLSVCEAGDGRHAIAQARIRKPSAILLDLNLPDMSGADVLDTLKTDPDTCGIPVLVFTAHHKDGQLLELRERGADGYLVKGGPMEQVLGYLQVLIQSSTHNLQKNLVIGAVSIDPKSRTVQISGQTCAPLTPKEFDLLYFVASKSPEVLTWEKLSTSVWKEPAKYGKDSKTIEIHAQRIRRKLGPAGACLITHKGVGLQFLPSPVSTY